MDLHDGAAMAGLPISAFVDELASRRVAILNDANGFMDELEDLVSEFGLPLDLASLAANA